MSIIQLRPWWATFFLPTIEMADAYLATVSAVLFQDLGFAAVAALRWAVWAVVIPTRIEIDSTSGQVRVHTILKAHVSCGALRVSYFFGRLVARQADGGEYRWSIPKAAVRKSDRPALESLLANLAPGL